MKSTPKNNFLAAIKNSSKPLNIAHRGGMGLFPENTLFAFESALQEFGVDALEIDLQLTKDNIPVVIHDSTIDRTTNGYGKVSNFTFNELQSFDAGYRFTKDNGKSYPFRDKNITIPSLDEFLNAFPNVFVNIELKTNIIALISQTRKLLDKYNAISNVIIGSQFWNLSRKMRPFFEECGSFFSRYDIYLFALRAIMGIPNKYFEKFDVLEIPMFTNKIHVPKYFAQVLHKTNLPVFVWDVDTITTIQDAINHNVNGLITDRPDLVNKALSIS